MPRSWWIKTPCRCLGLEGWQRPGALIHHDLSTEHAFPAHPDSVAYPSIKPPELHSRRASVYNDASSSMPFLLVRPIRPPCRNFFRPRLPLPQGPPLSHRPHELVTICTFLEYLRALGPSHAWTWKDTATVCMIADRCRRSAPANFCINHRSPNFDRPQHAEQPHIVTVTLRPHTPASPRAPPRTNTAACPVSKQV